MALTDNNNISFRDIKIAEFLGSGYFGFVFKAIHRNKDDYAIKIIFTDPNNNDPDKQIREFRNSNRHSHRNLVRSFGIESSFAKLTLLEDLQLKLKDTASDDFARIVNRARRKGTTPFTWILLERCGITLRECLNRIVSGTKDLADERRLLICCQIRNGLKYLHSKEILHRDLKPENIYLSVKNQLPIKIGDFGLSRELAHYMTSNVGTELYRAPEVSKSKYGTEIDIYSFGLVILEIFQPCTGRERKIMFARLTEDDDRERTDINVIKKNTTFTNIRSMVQKYTNSDPEVRKTAFANEGFSYTMSPQWRNINLLTVAFKIVAQMDVMPSNFMSTLLSSIGYSVGQTSSMETMSIRKTMDFSGSLFHFDKARNQFTKAWIIEDVKLALKKLTSNTDDESNLLQVPKTNYKKKPQIPTNSIASWTSLPATDELMVQERWQNVLGSNMHVVPYSRFMLISGLLQRPIIKSKSDFISEMLPYILQNLKMGSMQCFRHIEFPEDDTSDCRITRLDLIACLTASVDEVLGYDLFRILGQFSIPLPLLIPSPIGNSTVRFMATLPWLKNISIKRGTTSQQIIDNKLFRNPFKLVLVLRTGDSQNGKSSLLNSVLHPERGFSSYENTLEIPISLKQSVEVCWLTKENCSPDLYEVLYDYIHDENTDEVYLLANLHGDAAESKDIIKCLAPITSSYLLFHFRSNMEGYMEVTTKTPSFTYLTNSQLYRPTQKFQPQSRHVSVKRTICGKIRDAYKAGRVIGNSDLAVLRFLPHTQEVQEVRTEESDRLLQFSKLRTN